MPHLILWHEQNREALTTVYVRIGDVSVSRTSNIEQYYVRSTLIIAYLCMPACSCVCVFVVILSWWPGDLSYHAVVNHSVGEFFMPLLLEKIQ